MKHMIAIAAFLAVPALASCDERENPLAEIDPDRMYTWLRERDDDVVERMDECAVFWAEDVGAAVSADSRGDCVELADFLSKEMTEAGFGSIRQEDVYLSTIWTHYNRVSRANVFDPNAAAESMKPAWAN
ncbi:MAG: hypothetical protein AAGE90_11255 [Pseudomonadota bacterium]